MDKLIAFSALMMTVGAVMARDNSLPSPDMLPLLGIGALAAIYVARRSKK